MPGASSARSIVRGLTAAEREYLADDGEASDQEWEVIRPVMLARGLIAMVETPDAMTCPLTELGRLALRVIPIEA